MMEARGMQAEGRGKRILALDLATNTGFAIGDPQHGVLAHGTKRFVGLEHAARFSSLFDWLNEKVMRWQIGLLVFESPIMVAGRDKTSNVRLLMTMAGLAEMVALRRGVLCWEIESKQWRKHFLPPSIVTPKGRAELKRATLNECRERGWQPCDDNAADALAILDASLEHFNAGYSPPIWKLRPKGMAKVAA